MPWIRSHTNVERHKKTLVMAEELNIPSVHLSGHLHALWHQVLEQAEDGNLEGLSDRLIAHWAQFDGDAGAFVSALRKYHWLDGALLHDWLDYAGNYLTAKYRTANPEKLKQIYALHGRSSEDRRSDDSPGRSSQTKDRPESDFRAKNALNLNLRLSKKKDSVHRENTELVSNSESSEGSAEGRGAEVAEPNLPALSPASEVPAKRDHRGKNPRPWPEPFVITDNLRRWAAKEGLPTPESELDAFRDWAIAKAAVFSDWEAAFRTRLRNTRKFGTSTRRRGFDKAEIVREKTKEMLSMTYGQSDKQSSGRRKR